MPKVAFFVDGNFLFHQVKYFKSFYCDGPHIKEYCERHLAPNEEIYRIFYYDAPPLDDRVAVNPCSTIIDFRQSTVAKKMNERLDSVRETPFMALRLGKVTWQNDWILSKDALTDVMEGKRDLASLCDKDFGAVLAKEKLLG